MKILKRTKYLLYVLLETLTFTYFALSILDEPLSYFSCAINCLISVSIYFDILKECEDNVL